MADNILKTRIQNKSGTSADWEKAVNFVPLKGELIIYTDLNQMKIGDGTTKVSDLDFCSVAEHTHPALKIGPYSYDGTQSVTIPIYSGETN